MSQSTMTVRCPAFDAERAMDRASDVLPSPGTAELTKRLRGGVRAVRLIAVRIARIASL